MIVGQPVRSERQAPRRRLLDLLHGDQSRRVHRAAHLRLSRPARELAHGLHGRRLRHGDRRRSVRARRQTSRRCRPASRVRTGQRTSAAADANVGRRDHRAHRPHRRRDLLRPDSDLGETGCGRRRVRAPRHRDRSLRLDVLRCRVDADGTAAADRDLRPDRRRHALLVRVRTGRLDAESLRRSRDAHVDSRLGISEQLLPVAAAALHHHVRTDLCVDVAAARPARAFEPGEVRDRPAVCRRRFRPARGRLQPVALTA